MPRKSGVEGPKKAVSAVPVEDPPKTLSSEEYIEEEPAKASKIKAIPEAGEAETPKERKVALQDVLKRLDGLKEKPIESAAKEKAMLDMVEGNYLALYKTQEKKDTLMGRVFGGAERKARAERLAGLETQYTHARLDYAEALKEGALTQAESPEFKERVAERYESLKGHKNGNLLPLDEQGNPLSLQEFEQKQRDALVRRIRFQEVIKPSLEKKLEARKNALNERGQTALGAVAKAAASFNGALEKKLGKHGARLARIILGTTTIGFAGAAIAGGLGAFTAAGILSAAGVGAFKIGRSFAGGVVGARLGVLMANLYENKWGRKALNEARQKLQGRALKGYDVESLDAHALHALDAEREKLRTRSDEATLARKKAWVTALTAMGLGAGVSSTLQGIDALHLFNSSHESASALAEAHGGASSAAAESAVTQEGAEKTLEGVHSAAEVTHKAGELLHDPGLLSTIHSSIQPGEGSDRMFDDIRAQLTERYHGNLESAPPLARQILEARNGHILSDKFGFADGEHSMVMHEGDTVTINEEGQLVFTAAAHPDAPHVLLEADGVTIHTVSAEHISASSSGGEQLSHTEPEVSTPEPESTLVTTESLNKAELEKALAYNQEHHISSSVGDSPYTASEGYEAAVTPIPVHGGVMSLQEWNTVQSDTISTEAAVPAHVPETSIDAPAPHSGVQTLEQWNAEQLSSDIITNSHGIEIKFNTPTLYEWQAPGTGVTYTIVSGGTQAEYVSFAKAYAESHPGSSIMFVNNQADSLTGNTRPHIDTWHSNASGAVTYETNFLNPKTAQALSMPNPEDFIRKIP